MTARRYELQLDLYLPVDTASPRRRPAMVAVHGGGFSGGGRQSEATWCRRLAARGYVCAAIDYRLHPGSSAAQDPLKMPAIIMNATEDARAAIRWLRANAASYKIDPARLGAIGARCGDTLLSRFVGLFLRHLPRVGHETRV